MKISTKTIGFHHFVLEPLIRHLFDEYSATYDPISMKLGMLPRHDLTHMLINFCEVPTFPLAFIGF